MSLRIKLIITYIIMLVVSIILIVLFGVGIISVALHDSARDFMGNRTAEEVFGKAVEIIVDLRYTEKYKPEELAKGSFPGQIANQLQIFGGFLVVENGGQFTAYGNPDSNGDLYRRIDGLNFLNTHLEQGLKIGDDTITWNNEKYAVLQYKLQTAANGMSYYLVIKMKNAQNAANHYNYIVYVALILLTVIIIGPLLLIITKDIVIPLRKLENSAQQIAMGNLDFQLHSKSNNEIGSVIRSYEKMRYELKKSLQKQLEMEENRKQLLSNITHDLKTPITSIKGYIQGIRDGVANEPEKLSKYLDVIYNKSRDMDAMIDDLFLFSKLDLGKEPFNMDQVDIADFYGNLVKEIGLELDGGGVELEAECRTEADRRVLMDSQKIKRVILNIVCNSLKFMEKEKKKLNILFAEENNCLKIAVRDNGIGIDPEELEKVFDRFYRTDPSRNRNTGGSGLGLAIARQIVERHNGKIEARSVKGEWTEVSFLIPLDKSH